MDSHSTFLIKFIDILNEFNESCAEYSSYYISTTIIQHFEAYLMKFDP